MHGHPGTTAPTSTISSAPGLTVAARHMDALPSVLALAAAIVVAPATWRALSQGGFVRANYRRRELPFPFGVVIVFAAVFALVPLALIARFADARALPEELSLVVPYALGVAFLGLADDVLSGEERGWRGHGAAILRGGFSTGALKAVGALGLALYVLAAAGGRDDADYLLAVAVLVLATNLFNLLDLRPGRAVKAFVLLGAGLTVGAWDARPLAALGLFAAPVLVAGAYDVRERAMLGDTGSNLIGALAGLWLVLTLSTVGLAIATGVLVIVTAYGEIRSLSALIDRVPPLRFLDSIGRAH
jgi:UDP-N-acetylmuramyl pentapeptide phosphotransferase/UDP-N-acetylglucosamine-1-phosphate transferase